MRLLIIGTLNGQLTTATKMAMDKGAKVIHADDIIKALHIVRSGKGADLAMVDVNLNIAQLIKSFNDEHIHIPVVACGVENDASAAVRAIKAGAKEYIPLPPDADMIAAIIAAVSDEKHKMICRDVAMERVVELAKQVAPSQASILITGESGTGKEVMAQYIHNQSKRKDKQFISINCAAIPEHLIESELFGHEKGAFTGAVARRIGKFEEASGGTLLLDEISEMDVRLQAKLLRVIQERIVDRVGGTKPVAVDIRIIATSNRDLLQAVREGTFREDLLFRLNVVNLKLPALRERPNDIAVLAEHFVQKYSTMNGIDIKPISKAAINQLKQGQWKGNVRELENTIHRAVLLSLDDTISEENLRTPEGFKIGQNDHSDPAGHAALTAEAASAALIGQTVAEVEQGLILKTLTHCLGNRTHAANILGISIRTLRNKLKLYGESGVEVPAPKSGESVNVIPRPYA
ncbi:MAG: sigma-54-dependent Fis family transcriptional regulator [Rhizobiales bacterium]|nr:sigma-54-dependent Fis family transcriptional regulator [Hyphomicrobiales bacterium]